MKSLLTFLSAPKFGDAGLLVRLCLLALAVCACSRRAQPVGRTWSCMGTFASVTVSEAEKATLDEAETLARNTLGDLDNRFSLFKPYSEISLLNRAAGRAPVQVSGRAGDLLRISHRYADITGGAFDPTVAPLVRFWGFNMGEALTAVPDGAAIGAVLSLVGWRHLSVSNGTAFLDREGMSVDLGGIAKGYAVDACYRALVSNNVRNMLIDLGGNIRCRGSAAPGRSWSIGVRDPFDRERLIGTLSLGDGMAVATSGNYEKSVTVEGRRYAHIMDPRTGRPVEGVAAVTVIAANATEADAMSTAVFVMGMEASLPVVRSMEGCHFIFIPDSRPVRIHLSPGARAFFTPAPGFDGEILDIPTCLESDSLVPSGQRLPAQ